MCVRRLWQVLLLLPPSYACYVLLRHTLRVRAQNSEQSQSLRRRQRRRRHEDVRVSVHSATSVSAWMKFERAHALTHTHPHPHASNAECVYVRNGQRVSCNHKQMQWRPTTKMAIINFISVSLVVCVACLMPPNQPTKRSRYKCALSVRACVCERESLWKIRCRILFLFLFSYNEQSSHPRFDFKWRDVGCRVPRPPDSVCVGKIERIINLDVTHSRITFMRSGGIYFYTTNNTRANGPRLFGRRRTWFSVRNGGTHFE